MLGDGLTEELEVLTIMAERLESARIAYMVTGSMAPGGSPRRADAPQDTSR